jgi:hypothetical protein
MKLLHNNGRCLVVDLPVVAYQGVYMQRYLSHPYVVTILKINLILKTTLKRVLCLETNKGCKKYLRIKK